MSAELIAKIRRGLNKPPGYIARRLLQEMQGQAERRLAPQRARRTSALDLARRCGHVDVASWWKALASRPFLAAGRVDRMALEQLCPGDLAAILADGERALDREVDLLGSGPIRLGTPVDWQKDYKSGHRWAPAYCHDIAYNELDRPSDVKFPWELSRMQWLIPAGQAFAATGEERFAAGVRDVIEEWIAANPHAMTVNWACTMDVALRAMTWTWLFHALNGSAAWQDAGFRGRFLQALWMHGDFIQRNRERSDINGNHYAADAAGLVFVGLFFGDDGTSGRWHSHGWDILATELPRQVFPDGVDFEASVPYHRLVQELFLLPALLRLKLGLDVPPPYRERLVAMARFTAAYSRSDGSVPLWGDADDARALPFRQRPINDHRYLLALAGVGLDAPELLEAFSGQRSEAFWALGAEDAAELPDRAAAPAGTQRSAAFPDGGFYVLRDDRNHVFIDCGPLGLAGRGGHGHNDLLSFEAVLDGVHLVTDCGAFLYTASMAERNRFRSTAYHNTPGVDGEEINRFVRPDYLWMLRNDARHIVEGLELSPDRGSISMRHTGFERLADPVSVHRHITLDHATSTLTIEDELSGRTAHTFEIPLHLAPGARAEPCGSDRALIFAGGRTFTLSWSQAADWTMTAEPARVSPSYGSVVPAMRLVWRRSGSAGRLSVTLEPVRTECSR